jgi:ABC-2 type transport system ATP-binding protein
MPLIHLHRISRRFGSVQALCEVSLTLEPGTIGLVGNNGAGKSTLLKILLGLLPPDEGAGTILDCDIRRSGHDLRGRVGYLPETAAVVPTLKGVEFAALSGELYGMPSRDARRRAHEVLNYVGLGELRYRRLEEYSTGNLQRLKLAAALVHDPELLLLDEPTNGLDPAGRQGMLQLIDDLIAETGKSVVLCTHLLGDVERLCRQVVVLDRGTVVFSGEMSQLGRRGADRRYTLVWQGDGRQFVQSLVEAGVAVQSGDAGGNSDAAAPAIHSAVVEPPGAWPSSRFFQLAQEHSVVVTQLRPHEETLQDLFFRLTAVQVPATSEDASPVPD